MQPFRLLFSREAEDVLASLETAQYEKKLAKVRRTLGRIQQHPRHPGLNFHKYDSIEGVSGEEVWESYVENQTPSASRVFWHCGPGQDVITIVTIAQRP